MTRRQFLNDPDDFVHEVLEGLVLAHPSLELHTDPTYDLRAARGAPKVALVSGGGSGHEPLHSGFVGTGMLDAAVPGAVFASPTAFQVMAATKAADLGHGVLQIVKNYTGDVLNFQIAGEISAEEGTRVERVLVDDDLATDTATRTARRRGTGATLVVEKVCGAAAEAGATLEELAVLGRHGMGATHPLELSVCFREVYRALGERGIAVTRSLVGTYLTALDMAGVSLTLTCADDLLLRLWDAPVRTPALVW